MKAEKFITKLNDEDLQRPPEGGAPYIGFSSIVTWSLSLLCMKGQEQSAGCGAHSTWQMDEVCACARACVCVRVKAHGLFKDPFEEKAKV